MRCYYAHPITSYNTWGEATDIATIEAMGYEVYNPNSPEMDKAYKDHGMSVFYEAIRNRCDILAFRGFDDGTIPAGVAGEVQYALGLGYPVFELYSPIQSRTLTVEQTRAKLKQLGRK